MPLYEYHCEPCDHTFETLVRSSEDVPSCPSCGGVDHLAKLFSVPAPSQTAGRAGASSALPVCSPMPSGGCGAPQCGMGGCGLD